MIWVIGSVRGQRTTQLWQEVHIHIESERSTSSRLPARIIMKIFCGECSQCGPNGHEPAHTPHCMHILTHSPSSTCASTSLRKLLVYWASACWFSASLISFAPQVNG